LSRTLVAYLAVAPLLAACTLGSDETDPSLVEDSAQVTVTGDSTGVSDSLPAPADSAEAVTEQVAEGGAQEPASPPALTLDERIERLLASQEALSRRLDSLGASAAAPDSARTLGDSGEVLGEAGQRVQSFGVGVVWSVIVVFLFNLVIRGVVWTLDALAERNASRRLFYKRLVPIVRIILWVFAAYLIVSVIFQVDAQGLFAAAAAIGVAIGFAAQDLLKNLFGGLILVFDQPFQVGDKVSVGGTYGEVVSIGLRSTRIVTPDDNLVSVPNAQVVDQQVANANAGELNCQVVTDLYLPGWADEATAKRIAFDAAASSKYVYLNKPIVTLVADVFKETFLTRVRVKAYVLDPRLEFLFQSDVTERARAGFREAGLLTPEHMRTFLVEASAAGTAAKSSSAGSYDDPE
jgi:small-conductance mechanosensitive channel